MWLQILMGGDVVGQPQQHEQAQGFKRKVVKTSQTVMVSAAPGFAQIFQDSQAPIEAMIPVSSAPRPLTQPTAGVMATGLLIMPLTVARNVGFRSTPDHRSMTTQASSPLRWP